MKTIGIIGANGQVGTEVSLFLSQTPGIRVIAISRSVYGSTLLRHCGLECRHGSISNPTEARQLLDGCDLVADFSAPQGPPLEVRGLIASNIKGAIENSPSAKQYVYISSHSIFKHIATQARYRYYARAKQFGERLANKLGRQAGKEVFALRLGIVHGLMQTVSHKYLAQLRDQEAVLPDLPSLTVFCFSIAEALVNIANHKEVPGTYMLVATPAWSHEEVHEYYCGQAGFAPRTQIAPVRLPTFTQSLRSFVSQTIAPFYREIFREKELVDDLLSKLSPPLARRLRAQYSTNTATSDFGMRDALAWRPSLQDFDAPGQRMRSLSDSRTTMHAPTRALVELLNSSLTRRLAATRVKDSEVA